MTAYKWKLEGLYGTDAQTVGNELERIYAEQGTLEPSVVVEQSKPEHAPLHDLFEWDDEIAAEKWREQQARVVIANVMMVDESTDEAFTRAFVHVSDDYRPLSVVLEDRDMTEELLDSALRELRTFERKYNDLVQLAPVFNAIEQVAA